MIIIYGYGNFRDGVAASAPIIQKGRVFTGTKHMDVTESARILRIPTNLKNYNSYENNSGGLAI